MCIAPLPPAVGSDAAASASARRPEQQQQQQQQQQCGGQQQPPQPQQEQLQRRLLYTRDTRSYAEQFRALKGSTDTSVLHRAFPKPSMAAAAASPSARSLPGTGVAYEPLQRPLLTTGPPGLDPARLRWQLAYSRFWRIFGLILIHSIACGAFFTFTWTRLAVGLTIWAVCTCVGSSLANHRLLTHRTFKTHRAVEYVLAWIGLNTLQGPPIEWVSNHRWHHLHTDTPLDLHSPYESGWHAFCGWLWAEGETPYLDRANVPELTSKWFYLWMERHWVLYGLARLYLCWYFWGVPGAVWGWGVPLALNMDVIFGVNSVGHLWGRQPYDTGDLSRDNLWLALVTFGEGLHNSHHSFPHSARHGLEPWQLPFDVGFCCLKLLQAVGLVWDVRVPSEREKQRRRKPGGSTRLTTW